MTGGWDYAQFWGIPSGYSGYASTSLANQSLAMALLYIFLTLFLIGITASNGAGTEEATSPQHEYRVVCYLATWSIYIPVGGRLEVTDVNYAAPYCTHIVLLFASLDEKTWDITTGDARHALVDLGGLSKAIKLKRSFPHLKIMISMGGWNDGSVKYSRMVRDPVAREHFVTSVEDFLIKNQLDGVDINWQFPGDRGGAADDKRNFVSLIKELRTKLDQSGLILSVAVTAFPHRINLGTDGKGLSEHAHFLNILSYEYHAQWDGKVGSSAPLYSDDQFSVNDTISRYLEMGADPSKLNLGLSAYGTSFLLTDPETSDNALMNAPAKGGFHGAYNDVDGLMAYNELCLEMGRGGWREIWDKKSHTPYARKGDQVVSFDNAESYKAKIRLALKRNMGGFIFYGLEKDDFNKACPTSQGPFPLLMAINKAIVKARLDNIDDIVRLLKKKNAYFFWNGMKD